MTKDKPTKVTMEQIEFIDVHMMQKINLGNYETRDYTAGMRVKVIPGQDVNDVYSFARGLCTDQISTYYKAIKGELNKPKESTTPLGEKELSLQSKILDAKNLEQLESLSPTVEAITDKEQAKAVYNVYNKKKIELMGEKE